MILNPILGIQRDFSLFRELITQEHNKEKWNKLIHAIINIISGITYRKVKYPKVYILLTNNNVYFSHPHLDSNSGTLSSLIVY